MISFQSCQSWVSELSVFSSQLSVVAVRALPGRRGRLACGGRDGLGGGGNAGRDSCECGCEMGISHQRFCAPRQLRGRTSGTGRYAVMRMSGTACSPSNYLHPAGVSVCAWDLFPGLRCASPRATYLRPFGTEDGPRVIVMSRAEPALQDHGRHEACFVLVGGVLPNLAARYLCGRWYPYWDGRDE